MENKNKSIGLWAAVSIGVGGMVGAGIFSILGTACQIGGNAVYLCFIIAGLVALFSTYSYAKLGATYPSAGGAVEFLVRGYGSGIISGGFNVLLWFGYVLALALYSRAFASYALTFFHNPPSIYLNLFASGVIIFFVLLNFIGSKAIGKSEIIIVSIKVGILAIFAVLGFFHINPEFLSVSKFPPIDNIFFAAAIVFLAYEGFGLITNAADDMVNPKKTLPKALYLSVGITILIYVAVSLSVLGNLSLANIINAKDYALAEAAKPFLGAMGFTLIAIAALLSTSSAINATLYGGANVSYCIAKDGELPEYFNRKMWRNGKEGLIITAILVIVLANLFDLGKIAMMGSASFLLIYAAVNVGHLNLRKETNGNLILIWIAIIGNIASFLMLVYYLINYSIVTLISLIILFVFSFTFEWLYAKYSRRTIKIGKKKYL